MKKCEAIIWGKQDSDTVIEETYNTCSTLRFAKVLLGKMLVEIWEAQIDKTLTNVDEKLLVPQEEVVTHVVIYDLLGI